MNYDNYDYILWFLLFAWIPTLVVWVLYWRTLVKYPRVILFCILGSILFATPWDYWATHSWLWHFSPNHTLGIEFLGLPIEEYIFFVSYTVMYASIALVLRQLLLKKQS